MTGYENGVPGYLTFRVIPQEGPVAAFAEQEAWQARELYPDLNGLALAEFFHAKELDSGGWKLSKYPSDAPQGARDSLGHHFRVRAAEAEKAGDGEAHREWMSAAVRMDREVVDEIRVRGERFRIVRASRFLRTGPEGPEPPRPSDPDPAVPGEAHTLPSRIEGHVIDPRLGTGLADGLLRLDLLRFFGSVPGAPAGMREDALDAAERCPGGVLLPAVFMISERVEGRWQAFHPGASDDTPQGARDGLATWLRVMAPFTLVMTDEDRAAYARAADLLDEKRCDDLTVDGRWFRVTRVERLVRLGPEGPEGPRPHDFDPDPPVSVQTEQLKEQGLWRDEDDEDDTDPVVEQRVSELQALWEQELARRAAVQERRANRRGGARGTTDQAEG
ncbi:DUF5954 family protein [Streptomyces griseoviridis]|uniref:PE-PGRS family protein n=1 Tax=Streptomyces griseoviridis TaxID=45398 RepID=A0A3Q9KTX3_STRGD|nr:MULTISPECIES: DUF5954 family protein [Streptomyces]AZS85882.1 PE-PGRS family protein [Streptomyces griseoviridis]MDH6702623.1 hypothetical protein [Streptomyces sp. MAA16]QCN87259.1 PE-PGRS family protein [Streptomyces griseoviridis]